MKLNIQQFATGGVIMNVVKEYAYEQDLKETVKVIVTPDNSETDFDFENDFECSINDEGWTSTGENGSYYKIFNKNITKNIVFTYTNNEDDTYRIIGDIDLNITDLHTFYNMTICIDKQPMYNPSNDIKKYTLKLKFPLRSYGNITDQFILNEEGDYRVVRYLEKYKGGLRKLTNPIEETVGKLDIKLFAGDNYIYLERNGQYLMKIKYLTNCGINSMYATRLEMNSKIKQTVEGFELTVSKKVDDDEVCSAISQSAEEISIRGNRIIIESDNFNLSKDGEIRSTSGKIGGYSIGEEKLSAEIAPKYKYTSSDATKVMNYISGTGTLTNAEKEKYDLNNDGVVNASDYVLIYKMINTNTSPDSPGTINIDSKNALKTITLFNGNGGLETWIGLADSHFEKLTATNGNISSLTVGSLTNNSDKRLKKDIKYLDEKYFKLLDMIKPAIFKYKSDDTPFIGFIAQDIEKAFDDAKISPTMLKTDEFGIYSLDYIQMIAILWRIEQSLNQRIINLEKRIKKLEGDSNE